MGSLNKVLLIGRLGADPESRFTQGGDEVSNFTLATNEKWATGEKTEWHRIVAFKKHAEVCSRYLKKGKQVYLEGRLQTRQWEDREGNKRYTTEVVVLNVVLLGSRGDQDDHQGGQGGSYGQSQPQGGQQGGGGGQQPQGGHSQPQGQGQPQDDDYPF